MKQLIMSFIGHKDLYTASITIGSIFTAILSFFIKYTPEYILGISLTLWLIALIINIIDIYTGIKADTKVQNDLGKNFVFKSGKGWRAFEKVFVFTMIIWFIRTLELESIRLSYFNFITSALLTIKFILLVYVVLIEIQSIGENQQIRFGTKSKLFRLLDKIIELVNEGILRRVSKTLE